MPGREFSAGTSEYRYGFNGQNKDIDIQKYHYTAEFWEYDPRTGRRWNIDPISKHFLSNYSVLGDNPIRYSDPSGDDFYKDKKGNIVWNDHHGKEGSKFKINGKKYTNIGTSLTLRTNSEIRLPNDIAIGDFAAGSKLVNIYTITGIYDKNGEFKEFTTTFTRKTGVTKIVPGVVELNGTSTVPGKTNQYVPMHRYGLGIGTVKSGLSWEGSFEQHTQVNALEAPGLKLYSGGNIVDVNVAVDMSIDYKGNFVVNLRHGTFPSVRVDIQVGKDPFAAVYDYQQASFLFTHVTNAYTALATVKKANEMVIYQRYQNAISQKYINQSWIWFLGFNAGTK